MITILWVIFKGLKYLMIPGIRFNQNQVHINSQIYAVSCSGDITASGGFFLMLF